MSSLAHSRLNFLIPASFRDLTTAAAIAPADAQGFRPAPHTISRDLMYLHVACQCPFTGCNMVLSEGAKSHLDSVHLSNEWATHTNKEPVRMACPLENCRSGGRLMLLVSMANHLLTHAGRRQYLCSWDGCDRGFSQDYGCTRHFEEKHWGFPAKREKRKRSESDP